MTNTGNVALHSVTVSDPHPSNCGRSIGSLAVGASRTYTCTRAAVSSNFTNVATVKGLSPKGTQVTATDHAKVVVKVKTTNVGGANVTSGNKQQRTSSQRERPLDNRERLAPVHRLDLNDKRYESGQPRGCPLYVLQLRLYASSSVPPCVFCL